ncbi:MAG: efflux RND transporter periplasmic adaptor subunit [Acidobacteriota bacterium]
MDPPCHENRSLALLTTFLIAAFFFSSCAREAVSAKTEAPPPLPVRTVRLQAKPLEHRVEVTGTLISTVAVDIKTEVQGRLMSVTKEEGDFVQNGELVAVQNEENPKLGLQQAEANLETAIAALERVKVVEEHARIEDERAKNLLKSGGITDRDFQAAQMALNDAKAQRRLAEAQIEQARQAVAVARKRLDDCRVYSPISGEIERKYLNQGSYVDGGAVLYHVVDNQRLELEMFVSSNDLGQLKEGQVVRFSVPSYPGEAFEGRIKTINPAVQAASRSISVRASVPNPARKLKAGMFARGWIVTGIQTEGYMVPPNAVWRRANLAPFVFVVEQGTAHKREVTLGLEQPEGIEITQGLKPGDEVVTEQYMELADGSRVAPQS